MYVCQYGFNNVWVISNDVIGQYVVMIIGEVADDVVCFMNQQFVCGEVLWVQIDFKEIVNVICSDVSQIQCCRIGMMEVCIFVEQFVDDVDVGSGVLFCFEWEVGCQNSIVEIVSGVVVQMVVVQLCVLIVSGGEQFVMYRIVYYSNFGVVFDMNGDRYCEVWQMFDKVGSVIQWINNLLNILISIFKFIVFFGDDGVLWVRFMNCVDNYCFGSFIYVGYEIVIVFLVCFYSVWGFIVFGN